jgi:type IV pilus assembly protein PilN
MAHINLLPWREELARQKKQEFAFSAGGAVVIAALIVLMAHFHVDGLITNQNQRNAFLENEIEILNDRIGRIQQLEAMKDNLLARMNVIQELQSSRPESVHLLDELVRTLPEGVYLKTFAQRGKGLSMTGAAQSNARVSDYMRNIDSSEWFTGPRLDLIQTTEVDRRRIANFTLRGSQKARKPANADDLSGEVTP